MTEILGVILLVWALLVVWVALGAVRDTKAKKGSGRAETVEEWLEDTWRWER